MNETWAWEGFESFHGSFGTLMEVFDLSLHLSVSHRENQKSRTIHLKAHLRWRGASMQRASLSRDKDGANRSVGYQFRTIPKALNPPFKPLCVILSHLRAFEKTPPRNSIAKPIRAMHPSVSNPRDFRSLHGGLRGRNRSEFPRPG